MRAPLALLALLLWPLAALAVSPSLDGAAAGTGIASSGTTVTVAATTTTANDIVVVGVEIRSLTTTNPTATIAGCGLSWTSIGSIQFNQAAPVGTLTQSWYAPAASTLSACTITVTASATIGGAALAYCAFKDAYFAAPLDPNVSLPKLNSNQTGTSSSMSSGTFNTTNADDLGVAALGQSTVNMGGTNNGCANVTSGGGLRFASIYLSTGSYSTPQTGATITGGSVQPWWAGVTTALTADAPATTGRARFVE